MGTLTSSNSGSIVALLHIGIADHLFHNNPSAISVSILSYFEKGEIYTMSRRFYPSINHQNTAATTIKKAINPTVIHPTIGTYATTANARNRNAAKGKPLRNKV